MWESFCESFENRYGAVWNRLNVWNRQESFGNCLKSFWNRLESLGSFGYRLGIAESLGIVRVSFGTVGESFGIVHRLRFVGESSGIIRNR